MRKRALSPRKPRPAAHAHCEWLNDRHAGYCHEPAPRIFRHPRGQWGVLFVCTTHALDALAEGKPLLVGGGPVGGVW